MNLLAKTRVLDRMCAELQKSHIVHIKIKGCGEFPSDEALIKEFYLALRNINKKLPVPIRDWKAVLTAKVVLNRFGIQSND